MCQFFKCVEIILYIGLEKQHSVLVGDYVGLGIKVRRQGVCRLVAM